MYYHYQHYHPATISDRQLRFSIAFPPSAWTRESWNLVVHFHTREERQDVMDVRYGFWSCLDDGGYEFVPA